MGDNTPSLETIRKSGRLGPVGDLLRSLLAALIAWAFIYTQHPVFEVPKEYHITSFGASAEKVAALQIQQDRVDRVNAALDIAVLGGLLAAALALRKSACCPTSMRTIVATPVGVVVGAAAGFLGSMAQQTLSPNTILPTVLDTAKVQALLFATLGAGIGLLTGALAKSARSMFGGVIAGAAAGAAAGTAYPIVSSVIMPSASTAPLIPPEAATQLLWLGLAASLIALIVPLGAFPENPPAQSPAEASDPKIGD